MNAAALEIRDLRVDVPAGETTLPIIKGINLTVGKGEVVGLVGESGCGKSLSALACLGFVPPGGRMEGSLEVGGLDVTKASPRELRDLRGGRCAMIFQDATKAFNPFFTIGRQLCDVIRMHRGLSRAASVKLAAETLEAVRIPDPALALARYPHQISGGQLQRVMIAMALACEPQLLIADEPTTALDVTVQAEIISLLRALVRERELSILFITHDFGVVATLCDRVAVMYAGTIVEEAPCLELFERPLHPYTEKLLAMVPVLGRGRGTLPHIEGTVPDPAVPLAGCPFEARCERATEICRSIRPALVRHGPSHQAACHHVSDGPPVEMASAHDR